MRILFLCAIFVLSACGSRSDVERTPAVAQAATAVPLVASSCFGCHESAAAPLGVPRLNGQRAEYLFEQLQHFKWKTRSDPSHRMSAIAGSLTNRDMTEATNYFARASGFYPRSSAANLEQKPAFQRGEALARLSCDGCHMNAETQNRSVDGLVPMLRGQRRLYLFDQLVSFRNGERVSPLMHELASELTDQNIEDLALYFSLY